MVHRNKSRLTLVFMSWKRSSSSEKQQVAEDKNSFMTGRNRSPIATGCDRWNSISLSTSFRPLRSSPMSFSSSPILHNFNISLTYSQISHIISITLSTSDVVRLATYMYLNLSSTSIILCVPSTNPNTIKSTNLSHICSFLLWSVI